MADILMPKATAVWLIDNTSLTFEQIAAFCALHALEVKGIADGDVAEGVLGADPIANGQLTREEIAKAEKDPNYNMVAKKPNHEEMITRKRKGPALHAAFAPSGTAKCYCVAGAQPPGNERRSDFQADWHDQDNHHLRA